MKGKQFYKVRFMPKPGDPMNVPCDWCGEPSCYDATSSNGIKHYACMDHKLWLYNLLADLKMYKHLGKIR